MKSFTFLLSLALLLTACKSSEKVNYFQDIQTDELIATKAIEPITFTSGDKLSVIVSSALTPQTAQRYNLPIVTTQVGAASHTVSNQIALYTVDETGAINIPCLGRVVIGGLTPNGVAEKVQDLLHKGYLNDAVVTVNAYDQYITVAGEVKNPGRIAIGKNNMTLLEALGAAGDLTITGERSNILILRQEGAETKSYYVDLRSKDLLKSPAYNLRQNDYVYVRPNKMRAGQSSVNENSFQSVSTWLSAGSLLLSIAILIFN